MFLPVFGNGLKTEVKAARMRWYRDFADFGESVNCEFEDLRSMMRQDAREAAAIEHAMISRCAREAADRRDFDDLFADAEEEFPEVMWAELGSTTLPDLGVSGAVFALNALGCPTVYSCNGHQTGYPYVSFFARPSAVPFLKNAVKAVPHMGLTNGCEGCLEINADTPDAMAKFAAHLVGKNWRKL